MFINVHSSSTKVLNTVKLNEYKQHSDLCKQEI